MKLIAVIIAVFAISGYAQARQIREPETPPAPKEVEIEARFTAKVEWIELIGKRETEVVQIGFDTHFLVGLDILSVEKPEEPFDKRQKVVLLIHSPAMLFHGEKPKKVTGNIYSFNVSGAMKDRDRNFNSVKAEHNKNSKMTKR